MISTECIEPVYPCSFPVKVIGENSEELEKIIIKVMASCGEVVLPDELRIRPSRNGKYVSMTFTIVAKSREQIEQIYSLLNAQIEVKMVM